MKTRQLSRFTRRRLPRLFAVSNATLSDRVVPTLPVTGIGTVCNLAARHFSDAGGPNSGKPSFAGSIKAVTKLEALGEPSLRDPDYSPSATPLSRAKSELGPISPFSRRVKGTPLLVDR